MSPLLSGVLSCVFTHARLCSVPPVPIWNRASTPVAVFELSSDPLLQLRFCRSISCISSSRANRPRARAEAGLGADAGSDQISAPVSREPTQKQAEVRRWATVRAARPPDTSPGRSRARSRSHSRAPVDREPAQKQGKVRGRAAIRAARPSDPSTHRSRARSGGGQRSEQRSRQPRAHTGAGRGPEAGCDRSSAPVRHEPTL